MWLLDQWAERHIKEAQDKGEFDNLKGQGAPLVLDDDSDVPSDLRAGYRMLKNSGYLPPELELRREAIELASLLKSIHQQHPDYPALSKKLTLLKLRLQLAGMSLSFFESEYGSQILKRIEKAN